MSLRQANREPGLPRTRLAANPACREPGLPRTRLAANPACREPGLPRTLCVPCDRVDSDPAARSEQAIWLSDPVTLPRIWCL
jgi:hypothetical protein